MGAIPIEQDLELGAFGGVTPGIGDIPECTDRELGAFQKESDRELGTRALMDNT